MDRKMTLIIIVTIIVVTVLCFSLARYCEYREPKKVFARILDFELPDASMVLEHYYDASKERFDAKILIESDMVGELKDRLTASFGRELPEDYRYSPHRYIDSWWDLDFDNVILRYYKMVNGKKSIFGYVGGSTSSIWAYLVYSDKGEYYLYVSRL